jgi:hypothetical protein
MKSEVPTTRRQQAGADDRAGLLLLTTVWIKKLI